MYFGTTVLKPQMAPDSKVQTDEAYIILNFFKTSAESVTATLDTPTTTLAARVGQQVSITVRGDYTSLTTGSSTHPIVRVAAAVTAQPSAGSVVYPTLTAIVLADTDMGFATTGTAVGSTAIATSTTVTGTSSSVASLNYSGYADRTISGSDQDLATLTFTPVATANKRIA